MCALTAFVSAHFSAFQCVFFFSPLTDDGKVNKIGAYNKAFERKPVSENRDVFRELLVGEKQQRPFGEFLP